MGDVVVLDPACFIWDEEEFLGNKYIYYELLDKIIEMINLMEEHNVKFMLSSDTIDELINGFPVGLVSQEIKKNNLSDTINLIFSFLSRAPENIIDYIPEQSDIYSKPEIQRSHFSEELKEELKHLLKEISMTDNAISYLTIEEIWNESNMLNLYNFLDTLIKKIEVVRNPNELELYLNRNKRYFEPSPKHKKGSGWGTILPEYLEKECYYLIHTAILDTDAESEALYEYCQKYNEFVIFRITVNHTYHAYPISGEDVPKRVRDFLLKRAIHS
ncbi:hypothetical protein [Bacillus wiedmannii]|uniref:Uncharacterized protein n=1 Tax=Bacillus wiedmannii TaxID=1890302 RepID=A0A1C4FCL2_9BACI|nr:hypothetical protein [Bacillus wiedmannii]SCC53749.1 Protein of unknown function [Bacillus wiedmannii]